jgi:hypothetical protein
LFFPAAIFPFRRVPVRQVLLFLFFSGLTLPGGIRAEDAPGSQAHLFSTQWSASAYSEKASGTVCWIDGVDGSLRVEVLRNDQGPTEAAPELAPLLDRIGMGWTLVVGPDQNGTVNAWGSEWRQVPAGLAQLVRLVTASLHSYPDSPPRFPFATKVGAHRRTTGIPRPRMLETFAPDPGHTDTWRYQLAPLVLEDNQKTAAQGFRRKMTARGRGTGGVGEILILRWARPAAGDGYGLGLRSSRRPGKLHLAPTGQLAVTTPEPEVFLPLGPMSQFFTTR